MDCDKCAIAIDFSPKRTCRLCALAFFEKLRRHKPLYKYKNEVRQTALPDIFLKIWISRSDCTDCCLFLTEASSSVKELIAS